MWATFDVNLISPQQKQGANGKWATGYVEPCFRGVKVFESRRLKEKCRRLIIFYVLRTAPNMRDAKQQSWEGGFGGPPQIFFLKK